MPRPNISKEPRDVVINENYEDDDDTDLPSKRSGRRKIKIEYIQDKNRRHITFSKRKAGIMKKAYELSTLTGTQVLLLVVSETGLVYTFTTVKLQPIVTKPEGKNLIQACLNSPDPTSNESGITSGSNGDATDAASVSPHQDNSLRSPSQQAYAPPNQQRTDVPPSPLRQRTTYNQSGYPNPSQHIPEHGYHQQAGYPMSHHQRLPGYPSPQQQHHDQAQGHPPYQPMSYYPHQYVQNSSSGYWPQNHPSSSPPSRVQTPTLSHKSSKADQSNYQGKKDYNAS